LGDAVWERFTKGRASQWATWVERMGMAEGKQDDKATMGVRQPEVLKTEGRCGSENGGPAGLWPKGWGGATHQEGLRELLTDLLLALEVAPLGLGDQSNRAGGDAMVLHTALQRTGRQWVPLE